MAAILAGGNVEEEYLWSCSLSGSNKEYSWDPVKLEPEQKEESGKELKEGEEEEPSKVKPSHRLLIKSAILMPTAKKDEVTVVEIESEGYNKQKLTVPICAMKGGADLQKYVDLLVPGPSKIKIIHGEGPIHLVGSHCVEFFGFKEDEDSDDEDEEGDTENEMETEEEETAKGNKSGDKKTTPEKAEKKSTPSKDEKKSTPSKDEKKTTPTKDEKKRKNSSDPKSAEKKAKN